MRAHRIDESGQHWIDTNDPTAWIRMKIAIGSVRLHIEPWQFDPETNTIRMGECRREYIPPSKDEIAQWLGQQKSRHPGEEWRL